MPSPDSKSPLEEAEILAIEEVFARAPSELSDADLDRAFEFFRSRREIWAKEKLSASKSQRRPKHQKSGVKLADLNLSIGGKKDAK